MSLRPKQSSSTSTATACAATPASICPPPEGKLTVNEVRQMLDAKARADLTARAPELSHADMARILRQAGFIVVEPVGRVARK